MCPCLYAIITWRGLHLSPIDAGGVIDSLKIFRHEFDFFFTFRALCAFLTIPPCVFAPCPPVQNPMPAFLPASPVQFNPAASSGDKTDRNRDMFRRPAGAYPDLVDARISPGSRLPAPRKVSRIRSSAAQQPPESAHAPVSRKRAYVPGVAGIYSVCSQTFSAMVANL